MPILVGYIRIVDAINSRVGIAAAWLIFLSVAICALTAILRYAVGIGYVWMQELYVACFAVSFTLIAGYAYMKDQHVRVDIVSGKMTRRQKAWAEIVGCIIFLFPWLVVMGLSSLDFVISAWRIYEPSSQSGGMGGIFLIKTALLICVFLLAIQGLAVVARSILILKGREELLPPLPND